MSSTNILVVEDEALVAEDIKLHLEDIGYTVVAIVDTGEEALEYLKTRWVDLIMMDIVLAGDIDGITTAALAREQHDILARKSVAQHT